MKLRNHPKHRSVAYVALAVATLAAAGIGMQPASGASKTVKKPAVSELLIAAASDLRPAFEEIGKQFTEKTGTKLTFTFGSSGQLAQQIRNGAPFDVFASADVGYVDDVIKAKRGVAATKRTYAFGRLAIWFPADAPKEAKALTDLATDAFPRIAIANPEHAPYGRAAVQALQSTWNYDSIQPRLVLGDNVSDAYRLATSGNASAAIISLSLVIANANGGRYVIIPVTDHLPLEQAIIVTATKSRAKTAKAFVDLVSSASGRKTMRAYGFLLPADGEPAAPQPAA